jgi:hypothetical protein
MRIELYSVSRLITALLFGVLIATSGCDNDDSGNKGAGATPTGTPTSTPTPTVTATPTAEHHGPPHSIMLVGSTGDDSGALTVNAVPIAFVAEAACLGGTGDDCEGGTVLYSGTSPGFNDLTEDDPSQPIYVLPDGIEVTIELTAVDAGASVLISGVVLDEVGETAVVNTTGHLHNHPTWQLAAPGGEHPEDQHLTFVLRAEGFDASDPIALTLSLFEGDEGGEHGHDD